MIIRSNVTRKRMKNFRLTQQKKKIVHCITRSKLLKMYMYYSTHRIIIKGWPYLKTNHRLNQSSLVVRRPSGGGYHTGLFNIFQNSFILFVKLTSKPNLIWHQSKNWGKILRSMLEAPWTDNQYVKLGNTCTML